MKTILFLMFFLCLGAARSGEIALTFDDVPRGNGFEFTGEDRTLAIIKTLEQFNLQAAFFCNTQNLDSKKIKRIELYSKAGHLIGNHSHSHPDLDKTTPEVFIQDIQDAEKILRSIPTFQKWFRFPYLHEGRTVQDRDDVKRFLFKSHYQHGYVTVDSIDWYMEALFQKAMSEKRKVNYKKLGDLYVLILWEGIQFYDKIAIESIGRSPRHVLLLHENDLAALFLPQLIRKIQSEGRKLISPKEAYFDPIATMRSQTLFANQGQVAAIAKDRGHPGPFQSKWEDKAEIEKAFLEAKVFQ